MFRTRAYSAIVAEHLASHRQMAFVSGPRQVGKTTTCRAQGTAYLDWDNEDHRQIILAGTGAVAAHAGLDRVTEQPAIIVFDELHKYRRWRLFLKGFFDTYQDRVRVIVTGSSRLDTYRRGGDSLMGRYFPFRMHPFSVAEITNTSVPPEPVRSPTKPPHEDWQALLTHGGFPEPFTKRSPRFSTRWRNLRRSQLLREDIRDLTRIQELDQFEVLEGLLAERSGEHLVYRSLARTVRVSENTVRSWVTTLAGLHHGFLIRPWFANVTKALRKEPKWYLRDWSGVSDAGKRFETLCACHLLKAVEGWTDLGFGVFGLRYIRDRRGREVDFVVVRDGVPWFLVESKLSEESLSPNLAYFQQQTGAQHAFQVLGTADFVNADAFTRSTPSIVPAMTLLSQLL
jgi:predicted AAA+ superfamily ATPase